MTHVIPSELFSNEYYSRVPDLTRQVMLNMDDNTLRAYCSADRYNVASCNDEFWRQLVIYRGQGMLLPYSHSYGSLKEFALNVSHKSRYAVFHTVHNLQILLVFITTST